MDSTMKPAELIVQQGQNVLTSMKALKGKARKKGRERSKLYERYCANQHSFAVYAFIDPAIEQQAEVEDFQEKLDLFGEDFAKVLTDLDTEIDLKHTDALYEEVFSSYNRMVNSLGFTDQTADPKRF